MGDNTSDCHCDDDNGGIAARVGGKAKKVTVMGGRCDGGNVGTGNGFGGID